MDKSEFWVKLAQKRVLWVEIEAHKKEYNRLNEQIQSIEKAKNNILFLVQEKLNQIEQIGEFLLESEYKALEKLEQQNEKTNE